MDIYKKLKRKYLVWRVKRYLETIEKQLIQVEIGSPKHKQLLEDKAELEDFLNTAELADCFRKMSKLV